jgi:hypothetical protein
MKHTTKNQQVEQSIKKHCEARENSNQNPSDENSETFNFLFSVGEGEGARRCMAPDPSVSETEETTMVQKKKYKRILGSIRAWKILSIIFPENTKTYYNAILHLPITRDEPNQKSWSSIHRDHITKKKRDLTRWNALLERLVKDRLVSIVNMKSKKNQCFAIRKFKAKSKK